MPDKILKLVHSQSLKLIRHGLLALICSILLVSASAYAKDSDPLSDSLDHSLIGVWQNGTLSLNLKANGELVLKQSFVTIKAQSNNSIVQPDHKSSTTPQNYLGYWWSKAHRLCFLLNLSSQCMNYRLKKSKRLQTKTVLLQVQLGQEWVKFIRNDNLQAHSSAKTAK